MKRGNLYGRYPGELPGPGELFEELHRHGALRIVRIHSEGHSTPKGEWYDQPEEEWVALLAGSAELRFEDGTVMALGPGDWVLIPARTRHRVERTSRSPRALWLAVHIGSAPPEGDRAGQEDGFPA
jgi:cupin 2 domain-containing protein